MCPIDDPSIHAIGPLARLRQERVKGIPGQAVEVLRDAFRQALEDARKHPEQHPHEPAQERSSEDGKPPEATASPEQTPPEVYGPHGEPPRVSETHRLDVEG